MIFAHFTAYLLTNFHVILQAPVSNASPRAITLKTSKWDKRKKIRLFFQIQGTLIQGKYFKISPAGENTRISIIVVNAKKTFFFYLVWITFVVADNVVNENTNKSPPPPPKKCGRNANEIVEY